MIFKRVADSFPITDLQKIKRQLLTWAAPFNSCCFLDNQGYRPDPIRPQEEMRTGHAGVPQPAFECLLGVGVADLFTASAGSSFSALKAWAAERKEWLFGHFGYDLALETEPIPLHGVKAASRPAVTDPIGFPDLCFFVPEIVLQVQQDSIRIGVLGGDPAHIWEQIRAIPLTDAPAPEPVVFQPRITRDDYLSTIGALQRHILLGDCYEINFCQEFYTQAPGFDPFAAWQRLSQASPNPFSAFYRLDEHYLLCASPERFLKKAGDTLFSQPIKGTAPREFRDQDADRRRGEDLYRSAKDRAENVMVVDLVRNDLSKICLPGTVGVSELFGVYAFPQVFQLISTVTGTVMPGLDWTAAIAASFPMGSMTGAPKNRVVQLIAQYERSRRGIFSGAVGYVDPEGDFDFNVVIRSLLYNSKTKYLSYQVGSGITFYSDPAAEYDECLLKAAGIKKVFEQ